MPTERWQPACYSMFRLSRRRQAADASSWDKGSALGGSPDRRECRNRRWHDRACAPASKSGSTRAGRPTGGIPVIPACRRVSISSARRTCGRSTVKWPAPHRFSDDGGQSIGYKDHVILPLSIVPADPGKPVMLRLDLDYAICEKLCVPAEAKAELGAEAATAPPTRRRSRRRRRACRSPRCVGAASTPAIRAVTREAGSPRVMVDVAAPTCRHRPVRRGPDARVGAAPARAGRRRAERHAALRLRARRASARRQRGGRGIEAHGGGRCGRRRGHIPSRLTLRQSARQWGRPA